MADLWIPEEAYVFKCLGRITPEVQSTEQTGLKTILGSLPRALANECFQDLWQKP